MTTIQVPNTAQVPNTVLTVLPAIVQVLEAPHILEVHHPAVAPLQVMAEVPHLAAVLLQVMVEVHLPADHLLVAHLPEAVLEAVPHLAVLLKEPVSCWPLYSH